MTSREANDRIRAEARQMYAEAALAIQEAILLRERLTIQAASLARNGLGHMPDPTIKTGSPQAATSIKPVSPR